MYIVASFEQSIFLEIAISKIQQEGIPNNQILAVPLDKRTEPRALFDTIHRADGFSLLDVAAALGTCGMLLGAIYGMVLAWGPILWGLIGLAAGVVVGLVLKLIFIKRQAQTGTNQLSTEVFLLIGCEGDKARAVEQILWSNLALGVAKLRMNGNAS